MSDGLTIAERYHFEAFGWVLVEKVFEALAVERLRSLLYCIRGDRNRGDKGVYAIDKGRPHYIRMGNLQEYDRAFVDFATHPRLLAISQDLVGGTVALEETEGIINSRDPDADPDTLRREYPNPYNLHRAMATCWGAYTELRRYHVLLVKAVLFLTDVGWGDGGTSVVSGSHRMLWTREEMLGATDQNRSLVRAIEAKAGSVLFFAETLLHGTTPIASDRERVILTAGFCAPMFKMERGNHVRPEFAETLPYDVRAVLTGSDVWTWRRRTDGAASVEWQDASKGLVPPLRRGDR
jgi:hypothetical protein